MFDDYDLSIETADYEEMNLPDVERVLEAAIVDGGHLLTEYEENFCFDIYNNWGDYENLSDKQLAVIQRVAGKLHIR